jgi:HTH-type transcriptional regulator / antitoxin HipB
MKTTVKQLRSPRKTITHNSKNDITKTKNGVEENNSQIERIGTALKKARLERKFTQQQLSEFAGVGKTQISKLENDTGNVKMTTILQVFSALGLGVSFDVQPG